MSRWRTSAAGAALLACVLATAASGDMIDVEASSSRLVGGLTFSFNGRQETNVLAGTLTGSIAGGPAFDTYCIDLYHDIHVGANTYDVAASPIASFAQSPPSGTGPVGGDGTGLGWLYVTGETRLIHETGPKAVIDGAGLQVGLWKMAYDGGSASPAHPIDLATGNFRFLDSKDLGSNQHLVYQAAASFLAGYDGTQSLDATFLKVTNHGPGNDLWQDLVAPVLGPGNVPHFTPVPEPPSMALVGLGVGTVFAIRWRKRRDTRPD